MGAFAVLAGTGTAWAAVVTQDTLQTAVSVPPDVLAKEDFFKIFLADEFAYDDNIYRLPSGVTDLAALNGIGSHPSRADHIETLSAGADGQWTKGRQVFNVDVSVDDNRYAANQDLNNVSSNDRVLWNWDVKGVLTGQLGAGYSRNLAGFVNATVYSRDVVEANNYFGTARYQVGPRWALFAGTIESSTNFERNGLQSNDVHAKEGEFGSEFTAGEKTSVGLAYRYTDSDYPPAPLGSQNFREGLEYFYVKHAVSEKTSFDASAGYLKREYASGAIDSFSGILWSASALWKPTDKLQLNADAWRKLQAYLTEQSDYFVSRGGSVSPHWIPTDKVTLGLLLSFEQQDYIGRSIIIVSLPGRRDRVLNGQGELTYLVYRFMTLDLACGYQKRDSSEANFSYQDVVASAKVTFKF
jgi:hypothetical protein